MALARNFLGDARVFDRVLKEPRTSTQDGEAAARYSRESPRLSFYEQLGIFMNSVHRWGSLYRNFVGGQGEVVLAVVRLYPKNGGDARWIFVRPDWIIAVVDIKGRSKVTAKRQPQVQ